MKTFSILTALAMTVLFARAGNSAEVAAAPAPTPAGHTGTTVDTGTSGEEDSVHGKAKKAIEQLERCKQKLCVEDKAKMTEALQKLQSAEQRIRGEFQAGRVQDGCRDLKELRERVRSHAERIEHAKREIARCVREHRRIMERVQQFVARHPGAEQRFATELARLRQLDAELTACEADLKALHQQIRQTVDNLKAMAQQYCR